MAFLLNSSLKELVIFVSLEYFWFLIESINFERSLSYFSIFVESKYCFSSLSFGLELGFLIMISLSSLKSLRVKILLISASSLKVKYKLISFLLEGFNE
nr:hypothetical protein [Mycoplasma leonicaptivi]